MKSLVESIGIEKRSIRKRGRSRTVFGRINFLFISCEYHTRKADEGCVRKRIMKSLAGKTRAEIERTLAHKSRSELVGLIHSLVEVEQLLKPGQIAERCCLNKRAVLRDIRDGKFGDYFCRAENSLLVPLSGVNQWRNRFRVPAKPKQEARQ